MKSDPRALGDQDMTSRPLRVLVWGPGGLGRITIREITSLPELCLTGVLAYSHENDGVDAGTLAGIAPTGVPVTTDIAVALDIEADVVLHLARDYGRYSGRHSAVDDIATFLRRGRNVITVHPFHHPEAFAALSDPADAIHRIQQACNEGSSTFHATGINPGLIADRLAPTLTGLCTQVRSVRVYETWDHAHFNNKTLTVIGFGRRPQDIEANPAIATMIDNYCAHNLYTLARSLNVQITNTRVEHEWALAPTELRFPTINIAEGTVGRLTRSWHAHTAHGGPHLTVEVNWTLGRQEMIPQGMDPDHYYGIVVEGTPSLQMGLSITGSFEHRKHLVVDDDPTSEPGYYAVVATCLQAVPYVAAAAPGILPPAGPLLHWAPDFRLMSRHDRDRVSVTSSCAPIHRQRSFDQ